MHDDLIPAKEAAELLGIPLRTFQWRCSNGTYPLAAKGPGTTGAYLLRRSDIEAIKAAS